MMVDGTTYKDDTPKEVVDILERSRKTGLRIRIVLGDTETGRSWYASHYVQGYVRRSAGTIKIPLMLVNSRSTGGPGILDDCIIAIRHSNRKNGGWLYRHPKYEGDE